jgi:hypothetical protein
MRLINVQKPMVAAHTHTQRVKLHLNSIKTNETNVERELENLT